MNPPNWFPAENSPKPQIILHGHGDALACGACHLMTGSSGNSPISRAAREKTHRG
jgi:hypothetical protein